MHARWADKGQTGAKALLQLMGCRARLRDAASTARVVVRGTSMVTIRLAGQCLIGQRQS